MGSQQRNYLIHLPTHYQRTNDVAVPLVLDYHGWTGTAGMTVNYVKLEYFVISIISCVNYCLILIFFLKHSVPAFQRKLG